MFLFKPDGTVERVEYKDFMSINDAVGGTFTAAPAPMECGYSVYVHDEGLLLGFERNPQLEHLCQYAPLVGNGVVVSFQESEEEDLLQYIDKDLQKHWTAVLDDLAKQSAAPKN